MLKTARITILHRHGCLTIPENTVSTLDKKWWFVGGATVATALTAIPLLTSAGTWPISNAAQGLVCLICFFVIARLYMALGRFIIILAAPTSKLLD